nr:chondrolectin isoform X7 [Oryctolagus cuniculus]
MAEKPMRIFQAWKAKTLWQKVSYMEYDIATTRFMHACYRKLNIPARHRRGACSSGCLRSQLKGLKPEGLESLELRQEGLLGSWHAQPLGKFFPLQVAPPHYSLSIFMTWYLASIKTRDSKIGEASVYCRVQESSSIRIKEAQLHSLLAWQNARKRERDLPSAGSLPKRLQKSGPGQAKTGAQTLSWFYHRSVKDLSICSIIYCLPGCVSRELNMKQKTQDFNDTPI